MPRLGKVFESSLLNWIMTLVSVFMLTQYLDPVGIAESARGDVFAAVAWAVMLGIWLSTAVYKTWFRR